jgi:hypothetical protein
MIHRIMRYSLNMALIMETNLIQAKCGHCGWNIFLLYQSIKDKNTIIVECTQCNNTSIIGISKPQLDITFGDKSDGTIYFDMNSI